MLEQQSEFIRHCYDRAARAKQVAESSQSQTDRDFHLQLERNWLCLATSQAFAERVTRFVSQTANPVRREAAVAVLRAASFEQPLVEAMCTAFDAICCRIGLDGNDPLFTAIARAVIDQAQRGVKDSIRLERRAFTALGLSSFDATWISVPARAPARPGCAFLNGLTTHLPLRTIVFTPGQVLMNPGKPIERVYFPNNAAIGLMTCTASGEEIQTAMLAAPAAIGAIEALEHRPARHRAEVLVGGTGWTCEAALFRIACGEERRLLERIIAQAQALLDQMQRTILCNTRHQLESRLARWLLQARELSRQSQFRVTQDKLALLLGARRTSITLMALALREAGAIEYTRNNVSVKSTEVLHSRACACADTILNARHH